MGDNLELEYIQYHIAYGMWTSQNTITAMPPRIDQQSLEVYPTRHEGTTLWNDSWICKTSNCQKLEEDCFSKLLMQDAVVELPHLCQKIATCEYSQVIFWYSDTDSKNSSTVLSCVKYTNVYSFELLPYLKVSYISAYNVCVLIFICRDQTSANVLRWSEPFGQSMPSELRTATDIQQTNTGKW